MIYKAKEDTIDAILNNNNPKEIEQFVLEHYPEALIRVEIDLDITFGNITSGKTLTLKDINGIFAMPIPYHYYLCYKNKYDGLFIMSAKAFGEKYLIPLNETILLARAL
jgi:hypothetical protein